MKNFIPQSIVDKICDEKNARISELILENKRLENEVIRISHLYDSVYADNLLKDIKIKGFEKAIKSINDVHWEYGSDLLAMIEIEKIINTTINKA